jgi:hypothetical protein
VNAIATGKPRTVEEGGTWGSHYGGVVARSGGDTVTLENYARNRENEGIQDATSAMYYFQMYGSEKGQTWHETWASSDRRVINPLTQVMGRPHQEVWVQQLAALPGLKSLGDDPSYADTPKRGQQSIEAAGTREESMDAYRLGLLTLVNSRFRRYALTAADIGVEAGLLHFADPFPVSYAVVIPTVGRWIAGGDPGKARSFKSILTRREDNWTVQSEALVRLRDAMLAVHKYYTDRFPRSDFEPGDNYAPQARAGKKPKALKPKEAEKTEKKVKEYFVATQEDVSKYDEVKHRQAHYSRRRG